MALPPKFAGQKLVFAPSPTAAAAAASASDPPPPPPAVHTLELFLDFVCPFSARQFDTVYHAVAPMVRANAAWASRLQVVFRQQVQPWHPSSTLAHEAAVAVLRLAPDRYWAFADALFRAQRGFFDVSVAGETRNQTYARLARLAGGVGVDEGAVYDLLAIRTDDGGDDDGGNLNVGNGTTDDLKVMVKMARLVGVHVSPTVMFDGVVAGDISSGWTKEQWREWLEKNIA